MFFFSGLRLRYQNDQGIPTEAGAWRAHTGGCPNPRRLSRDEIDELQYELFKDDFPKFAILPVDYRCNLSCGMCCYHGLDKDVYRSRFTRQRQSLSLETIRSRLEKLAALGIESILIDANGEFLLRDDWEEIWRQAASLTRVSMTTNGTVLDRKKLESFLQHKDRIDVIKISLNALTPETWSLVSGVKNKGLFDTAMKAVDFLAANRVNVVASMVVTAKNCHEVDTFVKYWTERRVSVNIANELSLQDFLHGAPEVDNSRWPYYSCESINNGLMVCLDGSLRPCCRTSYCSDDANSYNIPIINLDDPPEAIRSAWRESLKNKSFKAACRACPLFSPRVDTSRGRKKDRAYGYKADLDAAGFSLKRKKSFSEKIMAEMNRFVRRVKKRLQ